MLLTCYCCTAAQARAPRIHSRRQEGVYDCASHSRIFEESGMHCYLGKRKGSDKWYIYQYDERTGQCPRFSTRTADRAQAEKKLAEHILKLPHRQVMNDATLVKIMLRYWEHHGQHTFAKDTVRRVLGLLVEH